MPSALDDLSRELRSAVLGEDHALAEQLAKQYTEAVRDFWSTLSEADRASSDIPKIARELLEWTRHMTIVQRALAARQIAIIQKVRRYQAASGVQDLSTGLQLRG